MVFTQRIQSMVKTKLIFFPQKTNESCLAQRLAIDGNYRYGKLLCCKRERIKKIKQCICATMTTSDTATYLIIRGFR